MLGSRLLHLVIALVLAAALAGCSSDPTATRAPLIATPTAPAATAAPTMVTATVIVERVLATATPAPAAPTPTIAARTPAPKAAALSITWYGQSTFVLSTGSGLRALLDPTGASTGYAIPKLEGIDLVTASHEHSDHNSVSVAAGSPLVLRGLAGSDWAKIDQTVKGARVRAVGAYHDGSQGSQRGKNAIFVFDAEGLRVAHLGDLGHTLSAEQIKEIGAVDVIMIPVGGYYTIDAAAAVEVVGQLNPKIVIPMHYKTAGSSQSLAGVLAPVDDFLKAMGDKATVVQAGQTITIEQGKLPTARTIMVLKFKE